MSETVFFRQLSPKELHQLACKATETNPGARPSLEACVRLHALAPWRYTIPRQEKPGHPRKAYNHAKGLSKHLGELRLFWQELMSEELGRDSDNPEAINNVTRCYRPAFEFINRLEEALWDPLGILEPVVLGPPKEDWRVFAQKLQAFFDAIIVDCRSEGTFGLFDNSPTILFVQSCLVALGFDLQKPNTIRDCLEKARPADYQKKSPGRKKRK